MLESILLYTVCWIFAFVISNSKYSIKSRNTAFVKDNIYTSKMPFWAIILIAGFCSYYNFCVTDGVVGYGSDRKNYLYAFENGRFEGVGLMFIMDVIHSFNGEFNSLLYISTFVSIAFILLAYRYSRDATPQALLLFFLSPFVFQTFTALKQCYANGFAALALMLLFQKKSIKKDVCCILLILLACLFHSAGYLIIPLYILLKLNIKIDKLSKVLVITMLFVIFFKTIMLTIANISNSVLPMLSAKILEYFGEDSIEEEQSFIILLKGLPYYYISYIGVKYRYILNTKIQDFDKYLLISLIGSLFYITTIYDPWMRRVTDILTFTIFVFWSSIINSIPRSNEKRWIELILMALFTYRWLIMIYVNFGKF